MTDDRTRMASSTHDWTSTTVGFLPDLSLITGIDPGDELFGFPHLHVEVR